MTPFQLEVLMHHFTSPASFPRSDAPGYQDAVEYWIILDVLERVNSNVPIRVTALGKIFIDRLLSTKVPISKTTYLDEHGNELTPVKGH